MSDYPGPSTWLSRALRQGLVIPAHPLALHRNRKLDERRQRALTRYYLAAGAGGLAVGVHTTQFEIRKHGLFKPVLGLAAQTTAACDCASGRRTVLIGGVCGRTRQAVAEAAFLRESGYHVALLSLAAWASEGDAKVLRHCHEVAHQIPVFGFYLQSAVGGRAFSSAFWREFSRIPNVVGIKIAPFSRYQTLDVIRGVSESGRADEIALYTGNDDQIVLDLVTPFPTGASAGKETLKIVGGLLGHWACWTARAVELFQTCQRARRERGFPRSMLTLAAQVTDCNAAFFDAANGFAGCIAGIHEVLRRQGLLENLVLLNPRERLSAGQREEIDRVYRAYPRLNDDAFVKANLENWLRE